jgi:hypothetical protein
MGIILDIIIIIAVLFFCYLGGKNGGMFTISRTFGWFIALVVAYTCSGLFSDIIKTHTKIFYKFSEYVLEKTNTYVDLYTDGQLELLPRGISTHLEEATDKIVSSSASAISGSAFSIIMFVATLVFVKLLLTLLVLIFSKRYVGLAGPLDGLTGVLVGLVQATITILILLAILMPLSYFFGPSFFDGLNVLMDESIFAGFIYYNNPLIIFVQSFTPENFIPNTTI